MKHVKFVALICASLCLLNTLPASAQESGIYNLEEIVITGRNRKETLQDVPVSTSVLSETLLDDAGITNLYDLFELVPGLHYDQQIDRIGAQPSIRGVQSNEIATNRTKVTAFIDGMPVLGAQGTIGFNSFQQIEIYRGPQSAAFGRSTFAGAINYITKDPSDELEASLGINWSDYGTRIYEGSIGGPITDSLGFLIQLQHEDSGSPSEYHATGNAAEANGVNLGQSDGTKYGTLTGDNLSAKLVFEPSDNFRAALTFSHVETLDGRNPELYLTEQARNDCFDGNGIRADQGMTSIWIEGEMDCDWDSFRTNYANHDDEAYLLNNPLLLDLLETNATANGAATTEIDGTTYSVRDQILLVARAYSIPESERGSQSDRDRFTLQTEYAFDNVGSLEFSYMHSEETQNRINDVSVYYYDPDNVTVFEDGVINGMAPGVNIQWNANGFTPDTWTYVAGGGGPRVIMAAPTEIDEDYAEIRWVSPEEHNLTYVVGLSYYDYDFLQESYGAGGMGVEGVGYGALLNGIVPQFEALTGLTFEPDESILSETATNTAAYFNLGYDINDYFTVSAEGRYQSDKIGGSNAETGLSESVTTKSFLPRFAASFSPNDDTTFYLQWSKGVNPAGVNVGLLDEDIIASIGNGIANALIPYDPAFDVDNDPAPDGDGIVDDYDTVTETYGTLTGDLYQVDFNADTFLFFDEEELTNFEIGVKGNLFDDRVSYSGAIFMIDWKDQLQTGSIQWDSPCADNGNAGAFNTPCTYENDQYFYVASSANTSVDGVGLNYGDVDIEGIELEASYQVTDNWDIRGTASFVRAKYDQYCDIALYDLRLDTNEDYVDALDIRVLDPSADAEISSSCYIADGNDVAGQPKLSGSLSPSYSTEYSGIRINARLDLKYEGEQWLESGNYSKYGDTSVANLSLTLSDDKWSATLYVNNITDENTPRNVSSGGDDTDIFGLIDTDLSDGGLNDFLGANYNIERDNVRFDPRTPRTIGFRGSYNF